MTDELRVVRGPPRIISGAVALLLALTLGACTSEVSGVSASFTDPDPAHQEIIALVAAFAHAVDAGDARAMGRSMCAQQAEEYLDQFADDQLEEAGADVPQPVVNVTNIEIKGTAARADVQRPDLGGARGTLYFRSEKGSWTVCSEAKADFG